MVYGPKGLTLTKSFENCELRAYQDSGGIWTIGWGHTGPEVVSGLVWTQEQADAQLVIDTAWANDVVNRMVSYPPNQNQHDATVDFVFNVGSGNFRGSTLLRMLNAGNFIAAAEQFPLWVHAAGEISSGLVRRRKAEVTLFTEVTP